MRFSLAFVLFATLSPLSSVGWAQPLLSPSHAPTDAAPTPLAPEVETRDADGRVTIRATRVSTPPRVDGRIDDAVYREIKSISTFLQTEPHEGAPATEKTEVWVLFDDTTLFISARCWQPPDVQLVANDMRRDGMNLMRNDNFGVLLDTFRDRRNGFMFQTTPIGAISEMLMTDEGAAFNRDWNTVWDTRSTRDELGWYVEMAIPFKSLRFPAGHEQVWGVNFRRVIQGKNEYAYLTQLPQSSGRRALARASLAATLVGLEAPSSSRLLEIKPFGIATSDTDNVRVPPVNGAFDARTGLDVKIGLGSFTTDVTLFTDFAQVEEDEAQVNLTRFSLFNPEKRDFFLEGQGLFVFGGVPVGRAFGGDGPAVAPIMFFSRQVGAAGEDPVQIVAGARVTGRAGPWMVGALQIRQDAGGSDTPLPVTDFTAIRVRRDILKRSSVGVIYTRRTPDSVALAGTNQVAGVDGYFALSQDLVVNAYLAGSTKGEGSQADALNYRGQLDYNADRYGLQAEYLVIGDDFDPQAGLLRREDLRRGLLKGRVSRRPGGAWLRRWSLEGSVDYITDNSGVRESHTDQADARFELENGDEFEVGAERSNERLTEALELTSTQSIAPGDYDFTLAKAFYMLGPRRRFTGALIASAGSFYGGTLNELAYRGRIELATSLSLEPNLSFNRIDLPAGDPFSINVIGVRTTWTISPRAVASALVQYDSAYGGLTGSARVRWEYRPGSELFLVYSEGRDTVLSGNPLLNRTIAIKATRLLRF